MRREWVGTLRLLLSSAGGLGEPARGWENRWARGSRSETWWGREYKSPIVLGSSAGALDWLESAKGCVCVCTCEGLGKRPMVRRGQRATGWLTQPHPPLAMGLAPWVWREVPS